MEQCDTAALGGATCASLGFPGGTLACNATCTFDTSGCSVCGDGTVGPGEQCDKPWSQGGTVRGCDDSCQNKCNGADYQPALGEECDGGNLGGNTCVTEGFTAGTPTCAADCTVDTSACTTCGNGVIEAGETCDKPFSMGGNPGCDDNCQDQCNGADWQPALGEECDGGNLGGNTCVTEGFTAGTPTCAANCTVDTSACTTCGDGNIETGETCDKPYSMGGNPGCDDNCQDQCNGADFQPALGEECDGGNLGGHTCAGDGFTAGTETCAPDCTVDTSACTTCGDGNIETGEQCDKPFSMGGNPGCDDNCQNECGDGAVNGALGEECDKPFASGGAIGCSTTCQNLCGNGNIEAAVGESCDPPYAAKCNGGPNDNDPCTTDADCIDATGYGTCGQNYGCNAACEATTCGDGVPNPGGGEQCDDGPATCTSLGASNGQECSTLTGKAACDADGGSCPSATNNDWAADACRTNCLSAFCGDGVADSGEGCDDGLFAGVIPNPNPAARQPIDDHDTCPNGTATVDAGKACITYNRCNDGNPNQVDSTARCQEGTAYQSAQGGCTLFCDNYSIEECDGGGDVVWTCEGFGPYVTTPVTGRCFLAPDQPCVTNANCVVGPDDFGPCGPSDTLAGHCRTTCKNPGCGDDVQDAGESCDAGDAVCASGGYTGECSTSAGNTLCAADAGTCKDAAGADAGATCGPGPDVCNQDDLANNCRSTCAVASCGDGAIDAPDEDCDDGDGVNGVQGLSTCTTGCKNNTCGDGQVLGTEECDDQNGNANDDCDSCILSTCGDGLTHTSTTGTPGANPVEPCDDGNLNNCDLCHDDCTSNIGCGDGDTCGAEVCDDGNTNPGDGCPANCLGTETCGDNNLDATLGELCDDGNLLNGNDGCSSACCPDVTTVGATFPDKLAAIDCGLEALLDQLHADPNTGKIVGPLLDALRASDQYGLARRLDKSHGALKRTQVASDRFTAGKSPCGALKSAQNRVIRFQSRLTNLTASLRLSLANNVSLGDQAGIIINLFLDARDQQACK